MRQDIQIQTHKSDAGLSIRSNVLILKPRLDVMFKQGPVPTERAPLAPIREHWERFVNALIVAHQLNGDDVTVIEKPLWQFSPEDVIAAKQELIGDFRATYIPHRQSWEFEVPADCKPLYYMQTVFPDRFTVDSRGWGVNMSNMPIVPDDHFDREVLAKLWARRASGESKFEQPERGSVKLLVKDYVLFICQLPDDQTIRYFSDVSVEETMIRAMQYARAWGMPFVAKGHPANLGKMPPLKHAFEKHRTKDDTWIDAISIHDAIEGAQAVMCVNSGSGFEVMMAGKPLYTAGHSEYELVSRRIETGIVPAFVALQAQELTHYNSVLTKYMALTLPPSVETIRQRIQAQV